LRATFVGLESLKDSASVAKVRGKMPEDLTAEAGR
jgi:hypothetical protein